MTNEIREYDEFIAQKAEVKTLADFVPNTDDKEGYDHSKSVAKQVRSFELKIDAVRKEIKAPALKRCQLIDSEAKALMKEAESWRLPHTEAVKAKDAEEDERKREMARLWEESKLKLLNEVKALADIDGMDLEQLEAHIEKVNKHKIDSEFAHYERDASDSREATVDRIANRIDTLKAEAAESERLAKEAAELAKKQEAFEAEQKAAEAKRKKEQAAQAKKLKADEVAAEKKRQAEAAEREKQRKIEAEKQAKIDAENARIAEEQKAMQDKLDAENKRIEDEKKAAAAKLEQEQADKEEAERKAALAPDKEKLLSYFDQLQLVAKPVIEDSQCDRINSKFQKMLAAAVDAAESIK